MSIRTTKTPIERTVFCYHVITLNAAAGGTMQQKITPNLWFDGNAQEAVEYYVSVFPTSKILSTVYYPKSIEEGLADFQQQLAGQPLAIEFELNGQHFTAINAGPEF